MLYSDLYGLGLELVFRISTRMLTYCRQQLVSYIIYHGSLLVSKCMIHAVVGCVWLVKLTSKQRALNFRTDVIVLTLLATVLLFRLGSQIFQCIPSPEPCRDFA